MGIAPVGIAPVGIAPAAVDPQQLFPNLFPTGRPGIQPLRRTCMNEGTGTMAIQVGDKIPSGTLHQLTENGPEAITTEEIFAGKKVVLFALPGAFTPTCSAKHLPGFVAKADEIKAKGVDTIACLSVNDAFVMGAWGKDQGVGDKVLMLADGIAEFTQALGLELDLTSRAMGMRSDRYAMIVDDGVVTLLNREEPRAFEVSSAEAVLAAL